LLFHSQQPLEVQGRLLFALGKRKIKPKKKKKKEKNFPLFVAHQHTFKRMVRLAGPQRTAERLPS
jgi:hypothetical protein